MAIDKNYNIPIFPTTFGAITMGAEGYSVPMCGSYTPCFGDSLYSFNTNSFITMPLWNNCTQPIFNFDNLNTSSTATNTSTTSTNTAWYNPSTWFNNWSFDFSSSNFWQTPTLSNFSWNFSGITGSSSNYSGDTFTRSNSGISSISSSGGKIIPDGYNSEVGLKFANAALKQAGGRTKGTGWCSQHVRQAMQEAGVYTSHPGHAADFIPILDKSRYFKKLTVSNINVQDLPAGCILVYGRGVEGYSADSGHIEVTTGDGRAASDFVHNVYKKPTAIYVPV